MYEKDRGKQGLLLKALISYVGGGGEISTRVNVYVKHVSAVNGVEIVLTMSLVLKTLVDLSLCQMNSSQC